MDTKYYNRNNRGDLLEMQRDLAPTLKTQLENLPEEILVLNEYWALAREGSKMPYCPITELLGPRGGATPAKVNVLSTFGGVYDCLMSIANKPGSYDHLNFLCRGEYIGIDLDDCRNPDTGELNELAKDFVSSLDTYCEVSKSGTGLHILCRGSLPPGGRTKQDPATKHPIIELFSDQKHCILLTGNILDGKPKAINDCTTALANLYKKYFGKATARKEKPSFVPDEPLPDHEVKRLLDDLPAADLVYDQWIKVAMALKSNGSDYEIFDNWCQQDTARYKESDNRNHWDSIKPEDGVSIGTLIWMWEQATGQKYRPSLAPQDASEGERAIWAKLRTTNKGIPISCLANVATVLEPLCADKVRLNLLSKGLEIKDGDLFRPITDKDVYGIREKISKRFSLESKPADIEAKLRAMALEYHPIRDCLLGLKWDGTPRVKEMFSAFFGCPKDDYHATAALLLLHGLIQRALSPGCKFDLTFILANPKQGTGKSTFCRLLAINDLWYTDTAIDIAKPADAYRVERNHWVVELGELQAFKGKDVEMLKSFLSACSTTYCEKFDKHSEDMPRQVVFIGTSNKIECLPQDPSGNRRFIPIHCQNEPIAWDKDQLIANEPKAREYIRQCFAEAYQIGSKNGWTLTPPLWMEKLLDTTRKDFVPVDPDVGVIQAFLDTYSLDYVCSRSVWYGAFQDGSYPQKPKRTDLTHITTILDHDIEGWKRGKNHKFSPKEGNHGSQVTWYRETQ